MYQYTTGNAQQIHPAQQMPPINQYGQQQTYPNMMPAQQSYPMMANPQVHPGMMTAQPFYPTQGQPMHPVAVHHKVPVFM